MKVAASLQHGRIRGYARAAGIVLFSWRRNHTGIVGALVGTQETTYRPGRHPSRERSTNATGDDRVGPHGRQHGAAVAPGRARADRVGAPRRRGPRATPPGR